MNNLIIKYLDVCLFDDKYLTAELDICFILLHHFMLSTVFIRKKIKFNA